MKQEYPTYRHEPRQTKPARQVENPEIVRLRAENERLRAAVAGVVAQLDKAVCGGRGGTDSMLRFVRDPETHKVFAECRAALAGKAGA